MVVFVPWSQSLDFIVVEFQLAIQASIKMRDGSMIIFMDYQVLGDVS